MDIQAVLKTASESDASDIHLSVGLPPVFRINGSLSELAGHENLTPEATQKILETIIDPFALQRFQEIGEVDFSYSLEGVGRFRVNAYRQRGTVSMAIRTVSINIPTLEALQRPEILKDLMKKKKGLILVSGPAGSGKSTTLASMIDYINRQYKAHVITIENPIEYLHKHGQCIIHQREIGNDSASYLSALKSAMRQDPDIILLGEMRDTETISLALNAAEMGCLVLSTIHTTGVVSTLEHILDMYPVEQQPQVSVQLARVIEGVISQQLISDRYQKSRVAAFEIMLANAAIRTHIREGNMRQISSVLQNGQKYGMITMDQFLKQLCEAQKITNEEALLHATEKNTLSRELSKLDK